MEPAKFVRRSERNVKTKRSFSPEIIIKSKKSPSKALVVGNNGRKNLESFSVVSNQLNTAKNSNCDHCGSSFIMHPLKKPKRNHKQSFSRHYIDQHSNKMVTLCNVCGLSFKYKRKPRQKKSPPSMADKEKYLHEARTFAQSLVEVLQDSEAERLYCPEFKNQPCACLQKYVLSDVNESQQRALMLLRLLKEAKILSQKKSYSHTENLAGGSGNRKSRLCTIGLGNGQKRSKDFETFVIQKRNYLRDELHLCERATQRVLVYSNNFLHKRLKTEPERERRIERKKGKSVLGLLKAIAALPTETCCLDHCTSMAETHEALLQQWRERASNSQAEAWRVLGEMLTPCGGGKTNCFKFIAMVTGCSQGTISKVKKQMHLTGGEREPPEHGLKRWWQEQAKKFQELEDHSVDSDTSMQLPLNMPRSSGSGGTMLRTGNQGKALAAKESSSETIENLRTAISIADQNVANSSLNLGASEHGTDDALSLEIVSLTDRITQPVIEIGPRQREQLAELQRHVIDWHQEPTLNEPDLQIQTKSSKVEQQNSESSAINVSLLTASELPYAECLPTNHQNLLTNSEHQNIQTVHHVILEESNFDAQFLSGGLGNIVIFQSQMAPLVSST